MIASIRIIHLYRSCVVILDCPRYEKVSVLEATDRMIGPTILQVGTLPAMKTSFGYIVCQLNALIRSLTPTSKK